MRIGRICVSLVTRSSIIPPFWGIAGRKLVGRAARVEEADATISRRDPTADIEALRRERQRPCGFHAGSDQGWCTYAEGGRLHCLFVKTLPYLTGVGPEDGDTAR